MPRLLRPAVVVPIAVVLAAGGTIAALPALSSGSVHPTGLDRSSLNAAALRDTIVRLPSGGSPAKILVDGKVVAQGSSGTLSAPLAGLSQGRHVIVSVAPARLSGTI